MNRLVLDLETTVQKYKKRKASPFCPENWVVAAGYKRDNEATFCNYFADREGFKHHVIPIKEHTQVLVGFNLKFDLLYMWGKSEVRSFFRRGGRIWDCQYVHYLLSGMQQSSHMVSMDGIVEEYGGNLKIDEVKALWESGVDTPAIDEDLLIEYLEGDIANTETIFLKQYDMAQKIHPNFLQMVWNRMDGLLATTEMEYNGLTVDERVGEQDRRKLQARYDELVRDLDKQLPKLPTELEFNWKSNHHRSYLLFGGTAKYQQWEQHTDNLGNPLYAKKIVREPVMIDSLLEDSIQARYLSGKRKGELKFKNKKVDNLDNPKGKMQEKWFDFPAQCRAKDEWEGLQRDATGNPIYQTNSDVIEYLNKTNDLPVLNLMAESQIIGKDLGTYYWSEDAKGNRKGMLTLIGADGRIHHKLNHTSTVTGRLSSSDPNMQNIPRGDKSLAKRMFISRFGSNGRIIEIDYAQLEVIVQGVLSRDRQLREDIRNGVDFHVKRLSAATGKDYDYLKRLHLDGDSFVTAERTRIKGFTFQRALTSIA